MGATAVQCIDQSFHCSCPSFLGPTTALPSLPIMGRSGRNVSVAQARIETPSETLPSFVDAAGTGGEVLRRRLPMHAG